MSEHTDRGPICGQVRKQLKRLEFPQTQSDELLSCFYPISHLREAFTDVVIGQILDCPCANCKIHLAEIGRQDFLISRTRDDLRDLTVQILGDQESAGSLRLFALLIHLEHSKFIIRFLERGFDDNSSINHYCLQSHPGRRQLEDHWAEFRERHPDESSRLAVEFLRSMYQFGPPVMRDRLFADYNPRRILPFYDEERLGGGAYGKVYGFKIHEDYAKIPGVIPGTTFARKELNEDTPLAAFYQERHNLDLVNQLRDNHIVEIIKSYRIGATFNIVFPRAKANLYECLRRPELFFVQLTTGPLRQARIWDQMRGLAKALDRIINYDPQVDNSGVVYQSQARHDSAQILGYHFDLKPANILVFDEKAGSNNVLKISDFGQAKFNQRRSDDNALDSRTTNPGGTDTYAAPEASVSDSKLNTRYDIWSMGCIFTELVVFAIRKYDGIRRFEQARRRQFGNRIDYRYFDHVPTRSGSMRPVLRPSVKQWIEDTLKPHADATVSDVEFLQEIEKLLFGMLEVNPAKRYNSKKVHLELERILASNAAPSNHSTTPVIPDRADEELRIDGRRIGDLRTFYARNCRTPNQDFGHAHLQVLDNADELEIAVTVNGCFYSDRRLRKGLHFVPKYAIRKSEEHRLQSDWDFRLISTAQPDRAAGNFEYQCSEIADARFLQGFLTGHKVHASFELSSFECRLHTEWISKQGARVGKGILNLKSHVVKATSSGSGVRVQEAGRQPQNDSPPYTMQIWKEHPKIENINESCVQSGRNTPPPRTARPDVEVAKCRLVVFRSTEIIVIPFSDATRLKKTTDPVPNQRSMAKSGESIPITEAELCPQRPQSQPYILAAVLVSGTHPHQDLPSIPLDLGELRELESNAMKKFDSISFTFRNPDDAASFREVYYHLKSMWDKERANLGLPHD